jgi:signal transduction histidine kinase
VLNAESKNLDAFDEKDRRLLSTLADQAALAIENAQLYEQMRAARDRLQALSRQLVEVQEVERRQIARELHDEIGQILTGLKLVLEMSGRSPVDEVRVNLDEALTLVNELVGRVRGLSLSLRPTTLDDLGLLPALRWHFERYTTQTNVRVAFKHTGLEGRRFAPEVETAAYRIVQEALTNVARHAEVGEVTVRLWADRDTLGVQVEDQGAGFDVESALVRGTSSGLSGMHERVTLLGGQLTIESVPGVGTRLTAEFPLAVSPAGPLGEPTETGKRYEHNDDRTSG